MWMDPAVSALIAEGDAAVDPLLRVLESDTRLTRLASGSEVFRRGPSRLRMISTVADVAYAALTRFLRVFDFGGNPDYVLVHGGPDGRKRLAGAIRAYWEKNKGIPPAERWYRTLRDDEAPIGRWQEAAYNLLQPVNLDRPAAKPGEAIPREGDVLRDRRDPSLSELLARRALDLARLDRDPRPGEAFPLDGACNLALALHRWDPEAARPVLAAVMKRCHDEITGKAASLRPLDAVRPAQQPAPAGRGCWRLRETSRPLDQAAEIVRRLTARDMMSFPGPLLDLMARYPRHPALASAADWLFNDPKSPWLTELRRNHFELRTSPWLLRPATLGVAGFRKRLEILLDDTSELGTVTVFEQDKVETAFSTGKTRTAGGRAVARIDPSASETRFGVSIPHVRLRRVAARVLAGSPPCPGSSSSGRSRAATRPSKRAARPSSASVSEWSRLAKAGAARGLRRLDLQQRLLERHGDQPCPAVEGDVRPRPLDHHDQPVAEADQEEDVDE